MRVLFLTKYDLLQGGVAEVLDNLVPRLGALGIQADVVSCDASAKIGRLNCGHPCSFETLPAPGRRRFLFLPPRIERLVSFCRSHAIDLVHAHGVYRPGYAAWLLRKKLGIPYVLTSHGDILPAISRRMRSRSGQRRVREYFRGAAALTHLNGYMEDTANRISEVKDKSFIIPNGVDLRWWGQADGSNTEARYMLGLGRLAEGKGFDLLLDAFAEALRRGGESSLVIAGDGAAKGDLEARARQLGLQVCAGVPPAEGFREPAVYFPGYVVGGPKRSLISGAAFVVFPSQSDEAFGIVQLEAMAAGKALVASDLPANRDLVVHLENGLVVQRGRMLDLSAAILRLEKEEGLRERFEANNLVKVQQYSWENIAEKYVDVYRTVCP